MELSLSPAAPLWLPRFHYYKKFTYEISYLILCTHKVPPIHMKHEGFDVSSWDLHLIAKLFGNG